MHIETIKRGTPCSLEHNPATIQSHVLWLRDALCNIPDPHVVDIGCGRGVYEKCLEDDIRVDMIGLDLDRNLLAYCREKNRRGEYAQGNAEALPLRDECLNVAMVVEVIEHVNDTESALLEIRRILVPRGRLLITAPNRGFPFLTHGISINGKWFDDFMGLPFPLFSYLPKPILKRIWSARCYNAKEFENILRNSGFMPERTVFMMPALDGVSPAMAALPTCLRRFAQRVVSRLDRRQSSWFGSTIAIVATKNPEWEIKENCI